MAQNNEKQRTSIQERKMRLIDLESNDKIDLSGLDAVLDDMEDMARKMMIAEFEQQHQIWQGRNGNWYTYLPEKGGRVLKKRKSRADLEKVIIDFMRMNTKSPTVADIFQEWIDRRLNLNEISKASYDRYQIDFRRFFKKFGKREIQKVTEMEIEDFLLQSIADFSLTAKSFSNLRILVYGIFKRAKKKGLVSFSITEVVNDLEISRNAFRKVRKADYEEVFMQDELPLVLGYLKNNPDIVNLGLLLMYVTGVRVGELVAIKFEDVKGNVLHICRTESHYKENGKDVYAVKDSPKTAAGVRDIVIPTDCLWIIDRIRNQNPDGEFLFMRDGSRVRAYTMRLRLHKVCREVNVHDKPTHKARKTYASILLSNGVDTSTVISLMGHTDISCTEQYYHRNMQALTEKLLVLDRISEFKA